MKEQRVIILNIYSEFNNDVVYRNVDHTCNKLGYQEGALKLY